MANQIDIIFNGVDKVSKVVNGITAANNNSAKSMLAMVGGYAAIGTAAYKAGQYIQDSINDTVAYGKTVRDMSRITGDSVEETSRLIQVTDDLMISQEELGTAMRGAVIKGVDTSIAGMAKLADEYLSLNKGLERSQFLTENFGRSGLKMGMLMEQGSEGILKMADAIDESLIMTDDAIKAAREYEIAVDDLDDSFQGFQYTLGKKVIPAVSDLTNVFKEFIKGGFSKEGADAAAAFLDEVFQGTSITSRQAKAIRQWKEYGDAVKASLEDASGAASEVSGEIQENLSDLDKAIQKSRDNMAEISISWSKTFRDQTAGMQELITEQANLQAEKDTLIQQGWLVESIAVQDVTDKMEANRQKIYELKIAQEEERLQLLANIATEGLDAAAKYDILNAMGLIDDKTYNLIESILNQKEEFSKTGDVEKYEDALRRVYDRMESLDGKTATMSLNLEYNNPIFDDVIKPYGPSFASGGAFTVPPGYPNDTYPMRVSSGEFVSVTPANEVGEGKSARGGGVNIYLSYSPVVSLADRYEAETKLVPYIESALRKIR